MFSKKLFAEVAALLISITSAGQLHGNETDPKAKSGIEIVTEAETSYSQGAYDSFLAQLHEQYQNAGQAGALRGIFESAKSAMKASPEEIENKIESYRTEVQKLAQERDQKLLETITIDPTLPIADRLDAIVSYTIPTNHSEVSKEFNDLKFHIPETAIGTIDNKISSLETEYYIKGLLLDASASMSGSKSEDFEQKKIAIQLEKFAKMQAAAEEIKDQVWMQKIETAKSALRAQKAYAINYSILEDLASGKIAPENSVEEKAKQIMMDFLKEKQEAYKRNISKA